MPNLKEIEEQNSLPRKNKPKSVTVFAKYCETFWPDVNLSLDENHTFVDKQTQRLYTMYRLGRVENAEQRAAHVIARVTPQGVKLASNPSVIRVRQNPLVIAKRLEKKTGQPMIIFWLDKKNLETISRLTEIKKNHLRVGQEES